MNKKLNQIFTNRKLNICLISAFVWGLIAHAYMYFNSAFSMDALNALYATPTEESWKLAIGRFLVPVFRRITGPLALPWVLGVLSLILIAIAAYVVDEMLEIKTEGFIVLTVGIMVTNLTVTAMTASYIYELFVDMIAMLSSVLAARYILKTSVKNTIIATAFLFISLGIYQSFISVTATIIAFVLIKEINKKADYKELISIVIHSIFTFLLGIICYFATNNIVCSILNITPERDRY